MDGCPGGWVGLALDPDRFRLYTAATLIGLLQAVVVHGPVGTVGVDIPIGLPDDGPRQADLLAARLLGPRRSSIFVTPVRAALTESDYATAVLVNRGRTGNGFSRQAYGLRAKVLEVDALVRDPPTPLPIDGPLLEVHPELSFATMAGAPMLHGKKTWAGAVERQARLAEQGIVIGARLGPNPGRAGVDDVLDAAAAAWTARRHRDGVARSLPDPPDRFRDGIACAIWV